MKKGLMMVVASLVLVLSACSKDNREKLYVYNVGEYIDPEVLKILKMNLTVRLFMNCMIQMRRCIKK